MEFSVLDIFVDCCQSGRLEEKLGLGQSRCFFHILAFSRGGLVFQLGILVDFGKFGQTRCALAQSFYIRSKVTYRREENCFTRMSGLLWFRFRFATLPHMLSILLSDLPGFIDMLLDEIVWNSGVGGKGSISIVLLGVQGSQTIVDKEREHKNERQGSCSQQILVRRHYSAIQNNYKNRTHPYQQPAFFYPFCIPLKTKMPILINFHNTFITFDKLHKYYTSAQQKNILYQSLQSIPHKKSKYSHYLLITQLLNYKWYHFINKQLMITYSILNYEDICRDVTARSKVMIDYKTIVQRRIRIESQYLLKLKELNVMPEMRKISNPTKASEIIFNSLINAIHGEVDNVSHHIARLETQILKQFSATCCELENESKREVLNTSILIKDYEKRYEEVDKLRFKVLKKGSELKKFKEEYIVGTLIDMPFDKKNKLFIKTKEIQQSYKPLREQFDHMAKNFNEKSNGIAEKLKENIKRIQNCENQKVELMKKIFMVLQISNSEYGANLIQDKASILSRLNNLSVTNPDFKPSDIQNHENYKTQMQIHLHDPCSYINNLFTNIVDTKNMQGLVIYGHEAKHRESISQCMTQSVETQIQNKSQFAFVKQVASCFKNIFNQDTEVDPQRVQRLTELMTNSPQGRKNFILCLQKFRTLGKFDISEKKLYPIQQILCSFLDQCMKELDTYNSKLLLVLSFTYYVLKDNQRVDLHNFIQQHKIWRDKQWWECALLQSSYEQIKVKPKKMEEPPITIWHIKGSGVKHIQGEHQLTSQNILFNQLTFYLHNMRLFEIKEEVITYLAKKYVKHFQLSAKIAADIEPFLKIQEVNIEEIQSQIVSPTGSPISFKKKASSRRLFSRNLN